MDEDEINRQLAPGMKKRLLEEVRRMSLRKVDQLMPRLKPASRADAAQVIVSLVDGGGMREASSLSNLRNVALQYARQNGLDDMAREQLLGELVLTYQRGLTFIYSTMDIQIPGWSKEQMDGGSEPLKVLDAQVGGTRSNPTVTVTTNDPTSH